MSIWYVQNLHILELEAEEKSNVQKMHIATSDKPISFYSDLKEITLQ